jgi:hypothetical protein
VIARPGAETTESSDAAPPVRMEERRDRAPLRDSFQAWSTIVANTAVAVTLGVALVTYLNEIKTQGRAAALSYVENFNDEPLLGARNRLYALWSNIELPSVSMESIKPKLLYELFARQLDAEPPADALAIRTSVINIADYLDGANTCLEEGVCDERIIREQLGGYARNFYCLYEELIEAEAQRLNNLQFGSGARALATTMAGC